MNDKKNLLHEKNVSDKGKIQDTEEIEVNKINQLKHQKKVLNNNIEFTKNENLSETSLNMNLINDLTVKITVELGNVKMTIKELLSLSKNKVIILDKLVGELLSIFANKLLIAYGEIVVTENKYGIRITKMLDTYKN